MRDRISLSTFVAALLVVVLVPWPGSTQSSVPSTPRPFNPRMSTLVDNLVGLGETAPQARIVLHLEGDDLCLLIAIPPNPTQLQAHLFRFQRKTTGDRSLEALEFKLPKKPTRQEDDGVRVWETCLEDVAAEQAAATELGRSFIEMTYRDPRPFTRPVQTTLNHPLGVLPIGVDVHKDSGGALSFSLYDATEDLGSGG